MAADKATDFIKRNRPPRVNIAYEDPYDSQQMVELPFVMGVMSDLSGNAGKEKIPLAERDFTDVTAATLDTYMDSVEPAVTFNVANHIDPSEGDKLGLTLEFRSMKDFGPAEIAKQVPALDKLLKARQHLANLQRYMNSKPKSKEQVLQLLNDPDLMAAMADKAEAEAKAEADNGGES